MSIKMKLLPTCERPYEKLEMYGEKMLSNAELLAIIIKTGTKGESSVDIAKRVLSYIDDKESLKSLQEKSIQDFMKIKGIGRIKAIQLKAVCEISRRISTPMDHRKIIIKNAKDVAKIMMNELMYEKREIVKVLILNSKNILLKIEQIAWGVANNVSIEIKEIYKEAIKISAPKIIVIHNHPSGDPTPSIADYETTQKMIQAGKILQIELLDHIIIGNGKYSTAMRRKDNIYEI